MASEDNPKPTATPRDIQTYHCICTHLILASTESIPSLPKRCTLDKSGILRLPSEPPRPSHAGDDAKGSPKEYSVLLGTNLDRNPIIVRGEDGFEKRYPQKCGRCNLTVGYQLDKSQFEGGKEHGRREDVIYLLPGGLMTTEEMASGKDMGKELAIAR